MVFYKFITNFLLNRKYTKIIKDVYKEDSVIEKFSQLFGTEFRMDWVGRLYCVINPNVIGDQLDINTQIFEYGENGLTNNAYIEKYIMTKLNAVRDLIIANNLFDLLTYRIEKLDEYDNYLFIIEPITFEDAKKWSKIFGITYGVLLVLGILALILL
jgi:hypothetical protein